MERHNRSASNPWSTDQPKHDLSARPRGSTVGIVAGLTHCGIRGFSRTLQGVGHLRSELAMLLKGIDHPANST